MIGVVVWLALQSVGAASAIDYDKVARPLVKEPAYKTKKPSYALLLFGPEAKLVVWAVLDGETVYIDRNGNGDLTDDGERFATEADCKGVEIVDPDGKTRYVIDRVHTDNTLYSQAARICSSVITRKPERLPLRRRRSAHLTLVLAWVAFWLAISFLR